MKDRIRVIRKKLDASVSAYPTRKEVLERVVFVTELLAKGNTKTSIKKRCKATFGIQYRATERYMRWAKMILCQDLDQNTNLHKAVAVRTYKEVIGNPVATPRDIIQAQKRLDRILGLEVPIQAEIVHSQDSTLQIAAILRKEPKALNYVKQLDKLIADAGGRNGAPEGADFSGTLRAED